MEIKSINPATGKVLDIYKSHRPEEIKKALERGQIAYEKHHFLSFAERAELMNRAAEILERDKERYAALITGEMGKTYASALAEVEKCALNCWFYAEKAESMLADRSVQIEGGKAYVRYLPLGIVLAVMPWNFPFWQVFRFAAPALMAGNVGILKHASNVPGCALAIEEVFKKAGFVEGAFQSLLIESDKVADLIADPRIKAVTLTGSEKAGASVASQAAKYIKKAVLELGGSDPFIVMPSANLDQALNIAVKGRVQNNGQTCVAAKRYIVHQDIYEGFKAALAGKYKDLKVGDPMVKDTDVGPLSTTKIRNELHEQVERSVAMGAVRVCGAQMIEGVGNFYQPGLLENVPKDSPAYKNELFGPVASLFKVKNLDEAIALANDTRFGLASVIFTQDEAEMERAVNEIEAGVTFVNGLVASDPKLPFGGVKASGFGRELSEEGIREFMNIKTIVIR